MLCSLPEKEMYSLPKWSDGHDGKSDISVAVYFVHDQLR
ncbi:MAG: hypothetical protein K0R47_810 [Brevibacillus sp.]|nr:hypothetical protein [Brevibacillus sp.]